ncbi:hypothetical protein KIN20_024505 [Parelaphostrongylus tenuis]|uniref:Uncharacterized protein n=1 Tax=Parelaphostrongylus tenuis TaxID=148309 RepID=A0AAD5MTM0_PARTN|nr:hypothetical protein KIN20_024505 [Parelaphostrongylus tenuis]
MNKGAFNQLIQIEIWTYGYCLEYLPAVIASSAKMLITYPYGEYDVRYVACEIHSGLIIPQNPFENEPSYSSLSTNSSRSSKIFASSTDSVFLTLLSADISLDSN